jgi:alpha-beta hydrolase superfamily lysophospholipase
VAFLAALGTIGAAVAQERKVPEPNPKGAAAKDKDKGKEKPKPKGGLRIRAGAPPKGLRANGADPLTKQQDDEPEWPFHYKFKFASFDGTALSSLYYPSRLGSSAPVVLLVHETGPGHSSKDFLEPIPDLKNQSLAEHLQEQGYAVLASDLRGHGENRRHSLGPKEWREMVGDLQATYQFLLDRHNRKEVNLAKFGVVALGDAANLVGTWAATPGAAVAIEGRISDIGALALVSPLPEVPEVSGFRLKSAVPVLAPRVPLLLEVGEKDEESFGIVKELQAAVERHRLSKVALLDSRLHGTKLLRFVAKSPEPIVRFLEATIKFRTDEWEPRYNLSPITYTNIELVAAKKAEGPEAAKKEQ